MDSLLWILNFPTLTFSDISETEETILFGNEMKMVIQSGNIKNNGNQASSIFNFRLGSAGSWGVGGGSRENSSVLGSNWGDATGERADRIALPVAKLP